MATNPSYKPNEGKREEFRRYLEKTGVMDALTKALVLLYEEADKPDDALLFIQNSLAKQTDSETLDELKAQIVELQEKITNLEEENQKLTSANPDADMEQLPQEGEEPVAVVEENEVPAEEVPPPPVE